MFEYTFVEHVHDSMDLDDYKDEVRKDEPDADSEDLEDRFERTFDEQAAKGFKVQETSCFRAFD